MKIVIHVGYPKAASSTLQKHLFDKHREINFLGIYPIGNVGLCTKEINKDSLYLKCQELKDAHYKLVMLEGISYFKYSLAVKKVFQNFLNPSKVNVVSNERLASIFFSHPDRAEKARRLREIFPNAKVLIIIRNQLDILKSQYRDHPFDPRNFSLGKPVSIDEWVKIDLSKDGISFLETLKYDDFISFYEKLFKKYNIKVLLFEDLLNNKKKFVLELSEFLEIDFYEAFELLKYAHENKGVTEAFNKYRFWKKRLTFILPKTLKKRKLLKTIDDFIKEFTLNFFSKQTIELSISTLNTLKKFFKASNYNLLKRGLEIDKYNYPM